MNAFIFVNFVYGISCFVLALLIFTFSKTKVQRLWALFNFNAGLWGGVLVFAGYAKSYDSSLFYWKLAHVPVLFISVIFYHLVYRFCNVKNKKLLIFVYIQGIVFSTLVIFTDFFIGSVNKVFDSFYYYVGNVWYLVMLFFWAAIAFFSFHELYKLLKVSVGIKRIKTQYLFYGMLLGFGGGCSTILPAYGLMIYPVWHATILIYALIFTYAIFRYHLMDIKVAFSRLGIFVFVYAIVLGIPFLFGYRYGMWKSATWSMLVLATVGPFTYLFIQKKTEERILQDDRRIQELLKSASMGFQKIRELDDLLEVLIDILTSSLRLTNAGIFLDEGERYVLKKSKIAYSNHVVIDCNDPLIKILNKEKIPLIFDEVKLFLEGKPGDEDLREVVKQMGELSSQVIIPILEHDFLLGFIVLGDRKEEGVYSQDMINVLSFVGDHAGLYIGNAIYNKESEKSLAEKSHDSRLRAIGGMGSGVAHQIRNRVNIITGHISFFLPILEKADLNNVTIEKAVEWLEKAKNIMKIIYKNAMAAEKICIAINSYSKLTDEKEPANLGLVFDMAVDVLRGRVDFDALDIEKNIPEGLMFYGVIPMVQDVFVNLIVNSRDAMEGKMERIRIGEWQIPDYRPQITVKAHQEAGKAIVYFSDNGTGFKPGHEQSAFVPFYTTKGTGVKGKDGGTGLGLNLIWDFLKKNGGDVELINKYKEGATFKITLPLPKDERKKDE